MSARDPETGQFVASDGSDADYGDFDYQHVQYSHKERGANSGRSTMTETVDILPTHGGLDSNEIAELVAIRYEVHVFGDDFGDVADTAQGHLDFRGVFGVDLGSVADQLQGNRTETTDLNKLSENIGAQAALEVDDSADPVSSVFGHDRDEVFLPFSAGNDTPFSSDAGGVGGGGGSTHTMEGTLNFREMVGRGPVLDSADDIGWVSTLTKSQVSATAEGQVRMTLVWDTATVDDAGRRFSVPSDD